MATAADRKGFVQTLRRGARSHEVPLVADNAARDKVKTMAETLLALDTLEEDEVRDFQCEEFQTWESVRSPKLQDG